MLTPSTVTLSDYIDAVKEDKPYHIKITFLKQNIVLTDDDIVSNGFTLQSYFNPNNDLTVGSAIMDEVNISVLNSSKVHNLIWNQEFKVEFGLEVGLVTDWVTIGYYTGERPEKVYNVDVINYTAHDIMYKFDVIADEWLASLTYPMTVGQMYASLCDYVGVTSVSGDELPNMLARTYITVPINATGLMCRTILALIAEACGCYAKITADNKVKLKWFSDQQTYALGAGDEFEIDSLDMVEGKKWKDLETETWGDLERFKWVDLEGYQGALRINSLTVKQTEEDTGVSYPSQNEYNDYLIIDNPFLVTNSNAEVQAYIAPLYNRLNGFGGYLPITATVVGNALVESGDVITVDVGGTNHRLPIFLKNLQWTGGMTDVYQSTGNVRRTEVTGEQKVRLSEGGRYHIWKNTVDQLYSELYDPTTGDVSVLKQTAQALGISAQGIDIQGGKYIKIESGGNLDVEGGDLNITSGGNLNISAGGIIEVDSQNFQISSADKKFVAGGWKLSNEGLHAYLGTNLSFDLGVDSDIHPYALRLHIDSDYLGNIGELYFSPGLYGIDLEPPHDDGGYIGSVNRFHSISARTFNYGELVQTSSKDIKHDIQPLPSVGDKLDELKPVTFVYDDDKDEKTRAGLIYEDTVEVLPEICTDDESNKAINYVELIPMLLKEIQDLRARVKALEEREVE